MVKRADIAVVTRCQLVHLPIAVVVFAIAEFRRTGVYQVVLIAAIQIVCNIIVRLNTGKLVHIRVAKSIAIAIKVPGDAIAGCAAVHGSRVFTCAPVCIHISRTIYLYAIE